MDVSEAVGGVMDELRALADPARAASERRYLKSELVHLGVPLPAIRTAARGLVRAKPGREESLALAEALWGQAEDGRPVHEARMAAIEVLVHRVGVLEPGDAAVAERLVRASESWVYVDNLAEKVVGRLTVRFPDLARLLDRWVADPCMWVRRTAMLALLPGVRTGAPDLDRISRYGDALLDEREFFIRKAVGWVLREHSKKDPGWVGAWVEPRTGRISGVTIREAVRHLPGPDAERLMAAYRGQPR
ncbi:DNA alkylation repair protein [Spirillospora sp. CA-294931]|uniref:DNA alkylation repair protein n=1 Tax=Spirillospora sp. CA-294931 TaxID=3240042 RepID=UPI003D94F55A